MTLPAFLLTIIFKVLKKLVLIKYFKIRNNFTKVSVIGILNLTPNHNFIFINYKISLSYHYLTGAYGPLMRSAEPSMTRRNPALDRLPASRVARGGKGELPVNQ